MELGKGEALVSFLEGNGTPSMVERAMIRPPSGRIGPVTDGERKTIIAKSPVKGKYDEVVDRESAFEKLQKRVEQGSGPGRHGRRRCRSVIRRRRHRRLARRHFRHQPQARRAADHRPDGRARSRPLRHDPRRRAGGVGTSPSRSAAARSAARSAAPSSAARSAASCAADRNQRHRGTMNASAALPKVLEKIDADLDKSLERLFAFLRLQSVSTDPAFAGQCQAAAKFVADDLTSLGLDAQVRKTSGHPVVVGKSANGSGPRVLFYGHYDVQPVDPLEFVDQPALRAADRGIAGRPQDHRRARRLRRQRPADDLRRGAAAPSRR